MLDKSGKKISIIHFNSRSLYANFENIKYFLSQFTQPLSIIAVSETWINNERVIDFELNRYDLVCVNTKYKNSGAGVALFVDRKFN